MARIVTRKQIDPSSRHYDFRADLQLLRSMFALCEQRFIPVGVLGSLNPFVVVNCRT